MIQEDVHLSYCTNIHPGENWDITFRNLQKHVPVVKQRLSPHADFGLGLRLSNKASEELGVSGNLKNFKDWLEEQGLYIFTMNGFPYGNFHFERVKDKVHAPDWTTVERLAYTKRLFQQLAFLLPAGISGGISTSPVSYKHWYGTGEEREQVLQTGAQHIVQIAVFLWELETTSGKYLHLDIEPEPDGLLENTVDVISFFKEYLMVEARKAFMQLGFTTTESESLLRRYITLCYDVCHFSLAYETPETTFALLAKEQIEIGKIQVSAALKILWDEKAKAEIWKSLAEFNEPVYLHQVTQIEQNSVKTYPDLPIVLKEKEAFKELRAHFHVPIFLEKYGRLYSTQEDIIKVINYVKKHKMTRHLEVETYTWDVLPKQLKLDLDDSIVRELRWLKEKFQ